MTFSVSSVTMSDAAPVLAQGLAAIASGETRIDLGELAALDSAAVAAMLAWQRAAQAKGVRLEFINMPAALRSLAQLYGVDTLLATDLA